METIRERIAFARGLASGLGMTGDTRDGKMTAEILHILEMIEEELSARRDAAEFSDQDIYEDYAADADEPPLKPHKTALNPDPPIVQDTQAMDDDWVECECPNCREMISLNSNIVDLSAPQLCPHCGMKLMIEFLNDD